LATAARFRALALAFPDASEAPHMERTAFRTPQRIFATLAADGKSANLKLSVEQQDVLASARPEAYAPVAGGWGKQGWTRVELAKTDEATLRDALAGAHAFGAEKKRRR
jgi:hypothetical protein